VLDHPLNPGESAFDAGQDQGTDDDTIPLVCDVEDDAPIERLEGGVAPVEDV
jgi:hypothetical protein